jgi:hypothetical protein
MATSSGSRVRRVARQLGSVAALGLLVWLLHRTGWDVVADSFVRVGVAGALLLVALGFLENLFDAASLRTLLPVRVGLPRLLSYTSAGALANLVVPWEGGEVLKAGLLRRHMTNAEMLQGLVVWNYLLKVSRPIITLGAVAVGILFGHALATGPLELERFGYTLAASPVQIVTISALLSIVPLLVMKLMLHLGVAGGLTRILIALRLLRGDVAARLEKARALDRDIRGVAQARRRDYWLGILYQVLARGFAWAAYGATMKLCHVPVSFGTVAMVFAALSTASFLVMASPVKIGVFEAAAGGVFELCGLDPKMGVIVIVIMRLKMIVTTGLAAVFVGAWRPDAPR